MLPATLELLPHGYDCYAKKESFIIFTKVSQFSSVNDFKAIEIAEPTIKDALRNAKSK